MDEAKEEKMIKLSKKLEGEFVDSIRAASDEKLKDHVINLTDEIEEQLEAKKANTVLRELRANAKALSDGYKNVINNRKEKIQLIMLTLESRGKL